MKKAKAIIIILVLIMAETLINQGLQNPLGGGKSLIVTAISESTEEREDSEMAKTTDRQIVNGETFMNIDAQARTDIAAEAATREAQITDLKSALTYSKGKYNGDLNDAVNPGIYSLGSSVTNLPSGIPSAENETLMVFSGAANGNYSLQYYIRNDGTIYERMVYQDNHTPLYSWIEFPLYSKLFVPKGKYNGDINNANELGVYSLGASATNTPTGSAMENETLIVIDGAASGSYVLQIVVSNAGKVYQRIVYKNNHTPLYSWIEMAALSETADNNVINCIGDSLTMGAADVVDGSHIISPYSEMLQTALGDSFEVKNQGIGGENSLTIAARTNSICAVLEQDITIPADTSMVVLSATADHGLLSIWDGETQVTPLKQGYELEGVYETGSTWRGYYVWINGIRCKLLYVSSQNQYQICRVSAGSSSAICHAGEPVIFERMKDSRNSLCDIYWVGTNDVNRTDLVEKIKAMISYKNNNNYIVIGLHNASANMFTDEMRNAYRKAFGIRFFDVDYYTRTAALADCGITPTSADTTAINNGLCPPSLMSDGIHFKTVFYQQIAIRLLDKMQQIGVIPY